MPGWIRVTPASARRRTCSFFRLDFVSQKTGEGGGRLRELGEEALEVARVEDVVDDLQVALAGAARRVRGARRARARATCSGRPSSSRSGRRTCSGSSRPTSSRAPSRGRGRVSTSRRSGSARTARSSPSRRGRGGRPSASPTGAFGKRPEANRAATFAGVVTPGRSSRPRPSSTRRTSSGKTRSPSPDTAASRKGKLRTVSAPITPSQFAPPRRTTVSGRLLLDPPRERERGDVLLEDAREADDPRPVREDLVEAALDERTGPGACAMEARDEGSGDGPRQLARSPAGATQEDFSLPPRVRIRIGSEERLAKDPLSRELADRAGAVGGDLRVEADAEELGEAEGEVEDPDGGAVRRQGRFQEREAEGRRHLGAERHRDEEDVGRVRRALQRAFSNQGARVPGDGPGVKVSRRFRRTNRRAREPYTVT